MARKSKIELPVRLLKLNTEQFFISEDLASSFAKNELLMSNSIEFGIDVTKSNAGCRFKFEIYGKNGREGNVLLVIEAGAHFGLDKEALDKLYNKKKNTFTLPIATATLMITVAVGAARGILHAKTEGTDINGIFIPLIDPIVNDDLLIELTNSNDKEKQIKQK
ncbi:hypothetical protein [Flavobacterium chungbukense]|uniref:Uncharacterized protein n=1 Tax=Flavobacterium chungbukense TaxID=877464 RepID=A0ABP7XU77_9FLAO|nr:hypothetical protein [Flavobacterium chungbukense]MCC4921576.1 hypothetical protein [Flavobacterium chungbukense]